MREVEIEGEKGSPNEGQKFFADDVELNTRTGELTASGNVVFSTVRRTHLGRHRGLQHPHQARHVHATPRASPRWASAASGTAAMFGTLEPDVYFYGEVIEKIDIDKYRITRGALHDAACSRRRGGRSPAAARS